MDDCLAGQIAIVTGAASGIGQGIAEVFAERGATVVVADINDEAGQAVADAIGGQYIHTDVAQVEDVENCVAQTISRHGALHTIVNDAGFTRFVDIFETSDETWDSILDVNLRGMFFFIRAGARHMKEHGGGSFVNIGSIAAKGYRHTSSIAYCASKGGVLGLTRASAMKLAEFDIRVNSICPGITLSPASAGFREENAHLIEQIPLKRATEPRDIGALAAFLASDQAHVITGQSWNVDGGLMID